MAKVKTKVYIGKKTVGDRVLFVYGEMNEFSVVAALAPVTATPRGHVIKEVFDPIMYIDNPSMSRHRHFNMGWAICQKGDEFDVETGIRIARRRFSNSSLETQNGKWLNDDMCQAIIANELLYMEEHLNKFINAFTPKEEEIGFE